MRARTFWRKFATIAADFTQEVPQIGQRNRNKARRIVKRVMQRQDRIAAKARREWVDIGPTLPNGSEVITMDTQDQLKPGRNLTEEDVKNVVERMRDTYNMPAGGTMLAVVPDELLPQDARERLSQSHEQESFEKVFGGATRDQLRKAFSHAGIKGFRNAKRQEFLDHMEGHWTLQQRDAVYEYLIGETK